MISGKRSILQKMLYLHFMMMSVRHPFSAFAPENTPLLRKNQYNYIRFDSLNPTFHYPRNHDSNIPLFHYSNCERSEPVLMPFLFDYPEPNLLFSQHRVVWARINPAFTTQSTLFGSCSPIGRIFANRSPAQGKEE